MADEQAVQVSARNAQTLRELLDRAALAVESALIDNESGSPLHRGQAAFPGGAERRRFWAAAQTGAKTIRLGSGRAGQEIDVATQRESDRANAPAIDACCPYTDEKMSVKGWITLEPSPFPGGFVVLLH